jgi:Ca2+-transporting ATPase
VLGFAYKDLKSSDSKKTYDKGLVFVGLQAMIDPPREEVKAAIAKCEAAGIKVMMITGDLKTTAQAIASELKIPGRALTGADLDKMTDDELAAHIHDIGVFARVNPEHKMRIVKALQHHKHVVAMTGDGVNDAPALKNADIGIAMGIAGTDVAKEASEMILTDDNFTSIVNAVEEGRGIYDNIRKFVNYLLSCNVGEVLVIFVGSLIGLPLPLLAVHLLWVNLVTDGLPAVALGVDPVPGDAMQRPPRKVGSRIMSRGMTMNVMGMGVLIAIATLLVYWFAQPLGLATARTMAFTTLVMLEIVRLHMIRSAYHTATFSNKWLIGAVLLSVGLQFAVLYTPLSGFLKAVPLGFVEWTYIAYGMVGVLGVGTAWTYLVKKVSNEMY